MWHGQHFMMPFLKRKEHLVKVLISRHRDGEINAIAARRLGVESIRGSGTSGRDHLKKGGVAGFKQMLEALARGYNVALTADIPKIPRVAGRGIVRAVARLGAADLSGRGGDQPLCRTAELGPLGAAICRSAGLPSPSASRFASRRMPTMRCWKTRGGSIESRLNGTTDRAYAIAEDRAADFDWSRRQIRTTQLA